MIKDLKGNTPRSRVRKFLLVRTTQIAMDTILAALCFVCAYVLRFEGWPPPEYASRMLSLLPVVVLARIISNYQFRIYRQVWRYVSIFDARQIVISTATVSLLLLLVRFALVTVHGLFRIPIGVIVIDFALVVLGMLSMRVLRRLIYESSAATMAGRSRATQRVLLVGAGSAGIMTVREIIHRPDLGMRICGFVDDAHEKLGSTIHGISVLGSTQDLPAIVKEKGVDQVIITIATAKRKTIRRILGLCDTAGVPVKIIPGLYEILGNRVTLSEIRPVQIEDLIARDTVELSGAGQDVHEAYRGKRILVTGAGGSIGSELCNQLLMMEPQSLILLDKDENAIFETDHLLRQRARGVRLHPVICDLKMDSALGFVFDEYRPQVVLHAGAHKHVGLMESNSCEAVLNNVVGTLNLLDQCSSHDVQRCIMVSTDKAVNPKSIMGATKRVSELLFQWKAIGNGDCEYSCVRFGNVLGSRGSVVPIFREQIRKGGPVTITHPDMVRFFMTIPEAVYLILRAGVLGKDGEIFVLDMGEPVKVIDLAKDMIRLSGLIPGEDIEIQLIGIKPGEKLKEELATPDEGMEPTSFEKIHVARPSAYDFSKLQEWVSLLAEAAYAGDHSRILDLFTRMGIGFENRDPSGVSALQAAVPMGMSTDQGIVR